MRPFQFHCQECDYTGTVISDHTDFCPRCGKEHYKLSVAEYIEYECTYGHITKVLDDGEAERGKLKNQDNVCCMTCGDRISKGARLRDLKKAA